MFSNQIDEKGKEGPCLPNDICCGCGACSAVCPVGCIDMLPDSVGFLRPLIRLDCCVSCGRCESVCPSLATSIKPDAIVDVFWAKDSNEAALSESSSGGVFGLLASGIVADGGTVYGAGWSKGWRVAHERICNESELLRIKKSKYVQSQIDTIIYSSVKMDLDAGRKVLYSGTGCQIAALKSYLGKNISDNLLCVEIICHGVPSPKLWRLYVDWTERKHGALLSDFTFRQKDPDWERYSVRAEFSDGSIWQVPYMKCWYMRAFMNDFSLRPSCHCCPFKRRSGSDLVLGDFWGIQRLGFDINTSDGISAVIVNTAKGLASIQGIVGLEKGAVEYRDVLTGNRSLEESASAPEDKYLFFNALAEASDLSSLMSTWSFVPSRWDIWKGRLYKAKELVAEYGTVKTIFAIIVLLGRMAALLMRGGGREDLRRVKDAISQKLYSGSRAKP